MNLLVSSCRLAVVTIVTFTALTTAGTTSAASSFFLFFLFVDPALDADDTVNGSGFCETVIDWHTKCLKRHCSLTI